VLLAPLTLPAPNQSGTSTCFQTINELAILNQTTKGGSDDSHPSCSTKYQTHLSTRLTHPAAIYINNISYEGASFLSFSLCLERNGDNTTTTVRFKTGDANSCTITTFRLPPSKRSRSVRVQFHLSLPLNLPAKTLAAPELALLHSLHHRLPYLLLRRR